MSRPFPSILAILGLAAVAATFPVRLVAQQITSPYEFVEERRAAGFFVGYVNADPGSAELGPQPGQIAGGRFTIRATGPLSVEAEVSVFSTDRIVWAIDTLTNERVQRGEAALSLLQLGGTLRFDITGPRTYHNFMPFVAGGGGLAFQLTDSDAISVTLPPAEQFRFGTTFAGHAGAGVEWFAFDRVTLRADGRVLLYRMDTPAGFRSVDPSLPGREWAQNYLVSASVSYRF